MAVGSFMQCCLPSLASGLLPNEATAFNAGARVPCLTQVESQLPHSLQTARNHTSSLASHSNTRRCLAWCVKQHKRVDHRFRGGATTSLPRCKSFSGGLVPLRGPVSPVRLNRKPRKVSAMAAAGPLVAPEAGTALWAVLAASAALGQVLENRTKWGASVSAPLLTMGVSIALSWSGVIPTAAPTYELVWGQIMPLAVCFYLLETDVRKVFSDAGTTLKAFLIGALGTVLGTVVAFACVGQWMGVDGWKMAACLCASYVGGSINYAATAQALGVPSGASLAAGMAADNLAMAAYFGVLMSWPTDGDRPPDSQSERKGRLASESVAEFASTPERPAASPGIAQLNRAAVKSGDVARSEQDGVNRFAVDNRPHSAKVWRDDQTGALLAYDDMEASSPVSVSERFAESSGNGRAPELDEAWSSGERGFSAGGRGEGLSGTEGNGNGTENGGRSWGQRRQEARFEDERGNGSNRSDAYSNRKRNGNGNGNENGNGNGKMSWTGTGRVSWASEQPSTNGERGDVEEERARPSAESVSLSLAAAAGSCCLGQALASALPPAFAGTELALMAVIASLISVTVGQMTSDGKDSGPHIAAFAGAETIGGALMQVFFAVVGATASLQEAINGGWPLLIFILVLLTFHVAFIAVLGSKVFKLPIRSVLIASNANVGGPATAAAMASAKGWPDLVRGALLTGTLGYTVGTAIGCLVGTLLRGM